MHLLFEKRPQVDDPVYFQTILNLDLMISNDRIIHYDGFNEVMLNKLSNDYL
jgi:hypothetical protein